MQNRRLGCFSFSALLAGFVTLLVIGGAAAFQGGAMFSPGDLNAQPGAALGGASSHADLSTRCSACHAAPWSFRRMPDRCLACHASVASQQGDPSSLHGALRTRFPELKCSACHPDHRGPQAALTVLDPAGFPHDLLGFALTGAHLQLVCADCHPGGGFQGAPAECVGCHLADDAHQGSFGADCAACHSTAAWKPATFDHSRSAFALTGAHLNVACEACHVNNRFQGTPADCVACHQPDDTHQGRFGADCGACHSTAAWKPATFDHARSVFQLTGAHASVACESCHPDGRFRGTPATCAGCHADPPYHIGLFGSDCAACHTVNAWLPARYDRAHVFPVNHEGADTCRDCHTVNLNTWTCTVCHPNAEIARKHQEEGIFDFAACLSCHPTGQEGEGGGRGGDD